MYYEEVTDASADADVGQVSPAELDDDKATSAREYKFSYRRVWAMVTRIIF